MNAEEKSHARGVGALIAFCLIGGGAWALWGGAVAALLVGSVMAVDLIGNGFVRTWKGRE